mmetsp:Transcript_78702/g.148498  ORF Transcript_78702/g.148498 Transcript_78702/m.148498 type:complete len:247 (-) Transcript_78702:131-871(-)
MAMSRLAVFMMLLVLMVATLAQGKKKPAAEAKTLRKPIVTTDIFYGTAELMYDIYADAWAGLVEPLLTKYDVETKVKTAVADVTAMGEKQLEVGFEKAGLKKEVVTEKIQMAQAGISHAKAVAYDLAAKAYEPMSSVSAAAVTKFEALMPEYAGIVPKTPGDVLLFFVYFVFVVYVLLKLTLLALKIALRIFCCLCCCCGCKCCCRKQATNGASKKAKGKKQEASAKAAAPASSSKNGKAPTKAKK